MHLLKGNSDLHVRVRHRTHVFPVILRARLTTSASLQPHAEVLPRSGTAKTAFSCKGGDELVVTHGRRNCVHKKLSDFADDLLELIRA